MENKNPQHKYFKICETLALMQDVVSIITFIIAIIQSYASILPSIMYLIFSVLILFIDIIIEYYYGNNFDEGHYIREATLLDNSFDEKRVPNYNSDSYFNNQSINPGEIKLLADIHENALFTSEITEKMVNRYRWCSITAFLLCVCIVLSRGMDDYTSALMNFIITASFFKRGLKIRSLMKNSKNVYDAANRICSDYEKNPIDISTLHFKIIELALKYENSLFESKVILDGKVFRKLNKQLSDEWEETKNSYKLYKNN